MDNKQNISSKQHPRWRVSLPIWIKATLLTAALGLFTWQLLEWQQAPRLQIILEHSLEQQLDKELQTARNQFDHYLKRHQQLTDLFALNLNLKQHLKSLASSPSDEKIQTHRRPPAWLPKISSWRGLVHPSHILLFDKNQLRELYKLRKKPLPPPLINPEPNLLQQAEGGYFTVLEEQPYLLNLKNTHDSKGHLLGRIMLLTPLDSQFLQHSQRDLRSREVITALFSEQAGEQRIFTSSAPETIPAHTSLHSLEKTHLISGKSFFDYGNSELKLRFSTLLAKTRLVELNHNVTKLERQQRLIAASTFITVFLLMVLYYSFRLRLLNKNTLLFCQHHLYMDAPASNKKDEMVRLEENFEHLMQQVIQSRIHDQNRYEVEKKAKQFHVLQAATEALDIGLILCEQPEEGQILTQRMHEFVQECGGLDQFLDHPHTHHQLECMDRHSQQRIFKIRYLPLPDGALVLLVQEISELVKNSHQAQHDALTGLPNRSLFMDRCQQALRAYQRNKTPFSLIQMDLNKFKEVNDTLGHHIGDLLLQQVSQRLHQHLRSIDTLARLGGDEFALLLPDTHGRQAEEVAKHLQQKLQKPMQLEDHSLTIGISMGITSAPHNGDQLDKLLQCADVAMYEAKHNQLGYKLYDPKQNPDDNERHQLINELREAIESQSLELLFQPQQNLSSGQHTVMEALIRWPHPRLGLMEPSDFLPLAEQNALIIPLTSWVLGSAIEQCGQWKKSGLELKVAVNLTSHSLQNENLAAFIRTQLAIQELAGKQLILELTENILMDSSPRARQILDDLDELGVQLSIDDFGTGYSSLSYLQQLPVNELKIDKSFILGMQSSDNDALTVHSSIYLAHKFGLKVVAEGVEDPWVLDKLKKAGCDRVQGYYIARPMSANQVEKWIKQQTQKVGAKEFSPL
ncbi:MAG: EAL domain-containing protein [Gammaproteobacteria bacterium]|nr:EAL domain-containing protein [Gammaproteobacteria bacterium]